MKPQKTALLVIFFVIISLFTGLFIGRRTVNTETEIEYIKQKPVSGNIGKSQLQPEKKETPINPVLPVKVDTVYKDSIRTEIKYLVQKVDTAAIIADYILKRSYNVTAFDNKESGTLRLFPTVQYNQLIALDYEFTPIQKQITIRKEKVWQPFVSGSYSTLGSIGIGGGTFYHNLGFEYQYQKNVWNKKDSHLFGLKYKFHL